MEVNRKSAPQREVLDIERTGSWGIVEYRHRLACGHTEVRKRPSRAPKIACTLCVVAVAKEEELKALALAVPDRSAPSPDIDVVADEIAEAEVDAQQLKAALSASLDCPIDAVDVVMEMGDNNSLSVSFVHIFLDIATARRLAQRRQKNS